MGMAEYSNYDGIGLAELVAKKEVSPVELIEAAIERIERHDGVLNAVVHKAYDEARLVAAGTLADGPFTGVPFLVKDSDGPWLAGRALGAVILLKPLRRRKIALSSAATAKPGLY